MENINIEPWTNTKKVLFRLLFIYLILYALPLSGDGNTYTPWWTGPVSWIGKHVLGIDQEIVVFANGSGDTTFHYVQAFLFFLLALLGTIVWSALDWKRRDYEKLLFWLTVYIRYVLAFTMMGYGFAKVIKTQFPSPFLGMLLQPVGELSPMRLLWTFMGYSTAYTVFAGMGEVLGGLFLFFRRTTLLGALILSIVLINVVIINLSYDVPVKLYSIHLLSMSLFLLAPHASRLWKLLVLNMAVDAAPCEPVFRDRKKRIGLLLVKIVLIGFIVVMDVTNGLDRQRQLEDTMGNRISYSGIYDVETFVLRGDTIPAMLNNTTRWKRVLVYYKDWASIEYMDGAVLSHRFESDTTHHTIRIISSPSYVYSFNYHPVDEKRILWKGLMGSDSLNLVVQKKGLDDFLLINRGFHWINEYPFNQ
jgi:hypothetical protein